MIKLRKKKNEKKDLLPDAGGDPSLQYGYTG